jgi:site-specific DNA-methyltransferase (adenine-specific)
VSDNQPAERLFRQLVNNKSELELLEWDDCGFDSLVCDPPAGIAFMNRSWDSDKGGRDLWIDEMTVIFVECFRVLKPGSHGLIWAIPRTSHWTATALEDAGFEVRDVIDHLFGCLSDDITVLTRRGWLHHTELTSTDEVLQSSGDILTWARPEMVHRYPYRGPMINLRNRHTDQLLTPNHRVYANVRRSSQYTFIEKMVVEARELRPSWVVDLPMAGCLNDGWDGPDPKRAYLVGWWLTDAWPHKDGKAAMFSQSKPKMLAKLRTALAPYQPSEYVRRGKLPQHSDEHTFYVTGPLADYLLATYPDRKLDWSVLGWSVPARHALLEGLLDGDGSRRESQHSEAFWSKDQERRDIVMALCVSLNIRAYDDPKKWVVNLNRTHNSTQLQKHHRDAAPPREYDGIVWCLTVPSGAFVVRRNGRPFITGNSGFPKGLNISKQIDKMAGAKREVIGQGPDHAKRTSAAGRGGTVSREGGDAPLGQILTAPATPEAVRWDGWSTALKPAHEHWILVRKPLEKGLTVAQNVLKYGTGGINIDGCRIEGAVPSTIQEQSSRQGEVYGTDQRNQRAFVGSPAGRWPANLILSHNPDCKLVGTKRVKGDFGTRGSDQGNEMYGQGRGMNRPATGQTVGYADPDGLEEVEAWECAEGCPVAELDRQSGQTGSSERRVAGPGQQPFKVDRGWNQHSMTRKGQTAPESYGDTGGASRFFKTFDGRLDPGFAYIPKASTRERSAGLPEGSRSSHPTVKPIDLMRYLVRLVTPPGGVVLDPFAGSGTTCIAAVLEGMGFMGIEKDPESYQIAADRIRHWLNRMDG